jgi:DNA gyrase subunit B
VNWEFFTSPELQHMMRISGALSKLNHGCHIVRGEAEHRKVDSPEQLLHDFMEKGKKGLAIQRYKGLGEMNPDQLWKTTMDPETRTLLVVKIEDVVEADEIFTILMGDKVEPRREFIQNNALEVTELDI